MAPLIAGLQPLAMSRFPTGRRVASMLIPSASIVDWLRRKKLRSFHLCGFMAAVSFCAVNVDAETGQSSGFWALLDEHDSPLPAEDGWYFNAVGGDRGTLNEGKAAFAWDGLSKYTITVVAQEAAWEWGGMWHSIRGVANDHLELDFQRLFGTYVQEGSQGRVTKIEVVVSEVDSPTTNSLLELRVELNDRSGKQLASETFRDLASRGCPCTLTFDLDQHALRKVHQLAWVIDKAALGDSVTLDRIRMHTSVPELPTGEQAFLWGYSWLMSNYDEQTGMVQDRSNFRRGDRENVTATAKAAKLTYIAFLKGFVSLETAREVIGKIAETLLQLPVGPPGVNYLWPHFTSTDDGSQVIATDSEWASGDTAFAVLDMIVALELLGDPEYPPSDFEQLLTSVDWAALRQGPFIGHGYYWDGGLIPHSWSGFGMETAGVSWALASVTGTPGAMRPPPTDDGSGFNDNASYPVSLSGSDWLGNSWGLHREEAAAKQTSWFCSAESYNPCLCGSSLYGLSAAEVPDLPGTPSIKPDYVAYGTGGVSPPRDGDGEVIVLHYIPMIADIRPGVAERAWETLLSGPDWLEGRTVLSPLNNLESMRVPCDTTPPSVNPLRGSWNVALMTEGWAMADRRVASQVMRGIRNNPFLERGYRAVVRHILKDGFETGTLDTWASSVN